jgi:hypothetical protein
MRGSFFSWNAQALGGKANNLAIFDITMLSMRPVAAPDDMILSDAGTYDIGVRLQVKWCSVGGREFEEQVRIMLNRLDISQHRVVVRLRV